MAIEDSPQTRKRYGARLKRLREAAGMTQEELAAEAYMTRTHIAHIESGRRRPSLDDARHLDRALGTDGFFEDFLPSLGEGKVADHFAEALELEKRAAAIREYAPTTAPGILQTRAYATAVLNFGPVPRTDEDRDKLLDTRLERSRIFDNFRKPTFWCLLDEAVLRRCVGGPEVMCEQIVHIAELAESRRIRVNVIPFGTGYHPLLAGLVSLLWFDDAPPVAYTEALRTGQVMENPSVVRECQVAYDLALSESLPSRASLAFLRSVAKEYEHALH